ncbi:unnamed protein product [Vitrella brassicaformis CCMP3155]|uniref:DNA topoisomerase (ATP-hydrolyzing) n=1 Tax=Vitrella brassicaformis (strain CCMP3155) TaxID=1169540 RepID=A0A0G4EID5_VITBC|nr:unnamed protein product [Vitrella brassicaformis CCMP3155]|eukprot:CEL95642.1 unnamed protein product [Vitrella brassicaformis CCMP3155]
MRTRSKAHLVDKLERELRILSNQVRFVLAVVNEELEIRNRKRQLLLDELHNLGFDAMSAILEGAHKGPEGDVPDPDQDESVEDGDEGMGVVKDKDYGYLLGMAMWNLTQEKSEELRKQKGYKETELDTLRKTTEHQLWEKDLDALDEQDRIDEDDPAAELNGKKGKRKKVMFSRPKGKAAKRRFPAANKARAKAARAKKNKVDGFTDFSDSDEENQLLCSRLPDPLANGQDGGKDKEKESSEERDAHMKLVDADDDHDDDHDDDMGQGAGAAAGGGKAAKAKAKANDKKEQHKKDKRESLLDDKLFADDDDEDVDEDQDGDEESEEPAKDDDQKEWTPTCRRRQAKGIPELQTGTLVHLMLEKSVWFVIVTNVGQLPVGLLADLTHDPRSKIAVIGTDA